MENYDLLMSCSPSEMLDLWKTVMRLTPVRRECTIERDDGIDLDALLTLHIRQWYAHLLATAPPLWLPVDDLKDHITLTARAGGVVEAARPPQCGRLLLKAARVGHDKAAARQQIMHVCRVKRGQQPDVGDVAQKRLDWLPNGGVGMNRIEK